MTGRPASQRISGVMFAMHGRGNKGMQANQVRRLQVQFKSPEHALRWAFEMTNRPIVKISSVNTMRGAETQSNSEMTVHDRHAQAALIVGLCERVLSSLHMAYVRAQFGRDASGFDLLTYHLAANFGTGLHSRRCIEKIIRSYCGEKVGIREIKKSMACGMLKAVSYRNQAYDTLDLIHTQAMDRLGMEMEIRGLRVAII